MMSRNHCGKVVSSLYDSMCVLLFSPFHAIKEILVLKKQQVVILSLPGAVNRFAHPCISRTSVLSPSISLCRHPFLPVGLSVDLYHQACVLLAMMGKGIGTSACLCLCIICRYNCSDLMEEMNQNVVVEWLASLSSFYQRLNSVLCAHSQWR